MKLKNILSAAAVCATSVMVVSSCSKVKEAVAPAAQEEISQAVLTQIKEMGLTTDGAQKVDGGYLVEGDILITP